MVVRTDRGFTIIEVMLFLAITGGLFAALMVGVNTGVTQQRYLDSVRSYKALVEDQYSQVLNTRNDEGADTWKCSGDAATKGSVLDGNPDSRDFRGTSECVILGRAIQVMDGGTKIVTSSVTGYDNAAVSESTKDTDVLTAYSPKLGSFDTETSELDWGAHLASPSTTGDHPNSTAVILILRSPTSGLIRVYTSPSLLGNAVDLKPLIADANSSAAAVITNCMENDSGLLPKQSITIDPRVASADAVSADGDKTPEGCQ